MFDVQPAPRGSGNVAAAKATIACAVSDGTARVRESALGYDARVLGRKLDSKVTAVGWLAVWKKSVVICFCSRSSAHEGTLSRDNLTHRLISTQVAGGLCSAAIATNGCCRVWDAPEFEARQPRRRPGLAHASPCAAAAPPPHSSRRGRRHGVHALLEAARTRREGGRY